MYTNYKYANSFGNRCAIFARPTGVGLKRTEVFILECSKKDPFSRKRAREVYENYLETGTAFYTKITNVYQPFSPGSRERLVSEGRETIYCHPEIIVLPFQFNNERITRFCETFLKRWISRQEVRRITAEVFEDYQIEK